MYSNIKIVYGSPRISKSLAPANKRKTHRTIVVVPQKGLLRIPPDDQDVTHVKIVPAPSPASRDRRASATAAGATATAAALPAPSSHHVYPYGTSLIRKSARDVKLRSKLTVFNITQPALGYYHTLTMDHAEFLSGFRQEADHQAVLTADNIPAAVEIHLTEDGLPPGTSGAVGMPSMTVAQQQQQMAHAQQPMSMPPLGQPPPYPQPASAAAALAASLLASPSSASVSPPMIDLTSHQRPITLFTPAAAALPPALATNGGNATYILPADCRYAPLFASKYKHIFEEVARLMRVHDSTAVQIQISASCGNAFQALKSALLKLHNITVLAGQQLITQTMPHTPQAVATFKFFHQDPGRVLEGIRPVVPRSTSYHETGVYQMWVSGATKKDLFDAVTLCASVVEKQPDVFNINVSLLTYPSIAAPHLPLYNEFTGFRLPTS
ncbi:protein UL117 [Panine betaherpesvirus 2]|uniref:Protein UL117 n=1 Tax=Panine betaherpesvirus 2 TaxID=188763 RepID=Q8QRZ1_9BETA|nr:protein UL117 [Panine betaherpesvirus 2]AAM00747.1 protein UL117 [Panine betaherpesvirus 2]QXV67861.1 protein UL117 [Panine betaherpesvirus 2]